MGKRLQWALVYVEDPPSREVLCENEFTDVGEFAVQKVRKMKRKSWSKSHACTILRTGTKTSLLKLKVKVDEHGATVVTGPGEAGDNFVLSRFYEKNKLKKRDQTARDNHLQDIDQELFANGPDGLMPQEQPNPVPDRRPKNRPQEELDELSRQLDSLPCLTWRAGDMEVSPGTGVYYNSAKLCLVAGSPDTTPRAMFADLLKRLVPDNIRRNPALSRTGERGTIQLPDNIQAAVTGFVQSITKGEGRKYHVNDTIRNSLYYGSHPRRKLKAPAPAPPGENNGLPDPLDGPPPHQRPAGAQLVQAPPPVGDRVDQPGQERQEVVQERTTGAAPVEPEPEPSPSRAVKPVEPVEPMDLDQDSLEQVPTGSSEPEHFFPLAAPSAVSVRLSVSSQCQSDGPALALTQMQRAGYDLNYLDSCIT